MFHRRAVQAHQALVAHFFVEHEQLFREHSSPVRGDREYSFFWPFTQAFVAACDVAALSGQDEDMSRVRRLFKGMMRYWDERSMPPGFDSYVKALGGGDEFYDDNAWAALGLLDAHELTGDRELLEQAEAVFEFLVSGWDGDPNHPFPGGIFWTRARWNAGSDRDVVSNAPTAVAGFRLFAVTGKWTYLEWARRCVDWVERTLRAPNGLYWDHVDIWGVIEKTQWSYNQGTMLGAHLWRHRLEGDDASLGRAREIADHALEAWRSGARGWNEVVFNAIFIRHLLDLYRQLGSERYLKTALEYGEELWTWGRDPATGLFATTPEAPVSLLTQAGAVQILATVARALLG